MGDLFGMAVQVSYQDRVGLMVSHHVALWDVVTSCTRIGSSDASIKGITVNDIIGLLRREPGIRCIALNGRTAEKLFLRSFPENPALLGITVLGLPSTSPANAGMSLVQKKQRWREILTFLI